MYNLERILNKIFNEAEYQSTEYDEILRNTLPKFHHLVLMHSCGGKELVQNRHRKLFIHDDRWIDIDIIMDVKTPLSVPKKCKIWFRFDFGGVMTMTLEQQYKMCRFQYNINNDYFINYMEPIDISYSDPIVLDELADISLRIS